MAQSVFKTAVAKVLSSYGVKSSDVTITSYSNGRRVLHDENQSRILTGQLQVSYIINFIAQSGGYPQFDRLFKLFDGYFPLSLLVKITPLLVEITSFTSRNNPSSYFNIGLKIFVFHNLENRNR